MGGQAAAERGELVLIISVSKNAFKIIKPIVEKIAKNIFYIGIMPTLLILSNWH
jgi:3-hydroxyisobutyrate dehydrogenase-like beta-hydroxyacid dehydrogenase